MPRHGVRFFGYGRGKAVSTVFQVVKASRRVTSSKRGKRSRPLFLLLLGRVLRNFGHDGTLSPAHDRTQPFEAAQLGFVWRLLGDWTD